MAVGVVDAESVVVKGRNAAVDRVIDHYTEHPAISMLLGRFRSGPANAESLRSEANEMIKRLANGVAEAWDCGRPLVSQHPSPCSRRPAAG